MRHQPGVFLVAADDAGADAQREGGVGIDGAAVDCKACFGDALGAQSLDAGYVLVVEGTQLLQHGVDAASQLDQRVVALAQLLWRGIQQRLSRRNRGQRGRCNGAMRSLSWGQTAECRLHKRVFVGQRGLGLLQPVGQHGLFQIQVNGRRRQQVLAQLRQARVAVFL